MNDSFSVKTYSQTILYGKNKKLNYLTPMHEQGSKRYSNTIDIITIH